MADSTVIPPPIISNTKVHSFGRAVAFSDKTVAISSPLSTVGGVVSGAITVFDRAGTSLFNPRSSTTGRLDASVGHFSSFVDDSTLACITYNSTGGSGGILLFAINPTSLTLSQEVILSASAVDFVVVNGALVVSSLNRIEVYKLSGGACGLSQTMDFSAPAGFIARVSSLAYNDGRLAAGYDVYNATVDRFGWNGANVTAAFYSVGPDCELQHQQSIQYATNVTVRSMPASAAVFSPNGKILAVASYLMTQPGHNFFYPSGGVDFLELEADGTTWTHTTTLRPPEKYANGAFFGMHLQFKSDTEIFISAPYWVKTDHGAVILYERTDSATWALASTLVDTAEDHRGDWFGSSFAYLSDVDALIIGAMDGNVAYSVPASGSGSGSGFPTTTVLVVVGGAVVAAILLGLIIFILLVAMAIVATSALTGASLASAKKRRTQQFPTSMSMEPLVPQDGAGAGKLDTGSPPEPMLPRVPDKMRLPPLPRPAVGGRLVMPAGPTALAAIPKKN
ncbi:hypothetical protein J8273_8490 [Carpediemonas membranifera]|uniref:Uncharacterized protein n=1 Tax=Carpediemonas membranifera TaxID=201153 RepID=A0A8J6BTY9_9EUKA|nr:hypothetical protein J8273_8490 [Carpediemonas membranifera]|eukprot:KAG9389811.1 hypothetical protein J8273_8490 [Carpediemonas membranifera]